MGSVASECFTGECEQDDTGPRCFAWRHLCDQKQILQEQRQSHLSAYGVGKPTRCIAISAVQMSDGSAVIAGFDNGSIGASVWYSGVPPSTITCPCSTVGDQISSVSISNAASCGDDGLKQLSGTFAVGTSAGLAVEWQLDMEYGQTAPVTQWQAHSPCPNDWDDFRGVSAIDLDVDQAVTGGADGSVCIWESQGGAGYTLARRINGAHGGATTCVASIGSTENVESGQAFSAGQDGIIRLWHPKVEVDIPMHARDLRQPRYPVAALKYDSFTARLVSGSEDFFVRMWDVTAGRPTRRFLHEPSDSVVVQTMVRRGVQAVAFNSSKDSLSQLVSAAVDGSWRLWDVRQNSHVKEEGQKEHGNPIIAVALKNELLLTCSEDGLLATWDTRMIKATSLEKACMIGLLQSASPRGRKRDNVADEIGQCCANATLCTA